jgi:hypothetical protein
MRNIKIRKAEKGHGYCILFDDVDVSPFFQKVDISFTYQGAKATAVIVGYLDIDIDADVDEVGE